MLLIRKQVRLPRGELRMLSWDDYLQAIIATIGAQLALNGIKSFFEL
jgi:hypothetical protein